MFVVPVLLPQYPAALQSFGRYLAFGLVALPLAWWDRQRLRQLTRQDWLAALELAAVGNVVYYLFLAAAIQRAGAPLPIMIIGTLPVVIAVVSNRRDARRDGRLPWRRLLPPLVLLALGIALVHHAEVTPSGTAAVALSPADALWGTVLAVGAVVCWTWYPIRNADWMRAHPDRPSGTWATAQGVATLPLAILGYASYWAWNGVSGQPFEMPLGPEPLRFAALMLALGLLASWLGTLCWNQASKRLPTRLAGQMIVFETLAALSYAFALRGQWPGLAVAAGILLLVAGVALALRARPGG